MKHYSFTTKLLGLFLLPFALFGGPVSLLCVGSDGHFALETGWDGSCESIVACDDQQGHDTGGSACHDEAPERAGCHDHEDCCGDCVDFSLQLDEAVGRAFGEDLLNAPAVASLPERVVFGYTIDNLIPVAFSSGPPRFSSSPLSAYLTLRLLI